LTKIGVVILMTKTIKINYALINENTRLKNHFHNGYEMIYIEKGSAQFIVGGHSIDFQENSLIFINNLENHSMIPITTPYVRYAFVLESEFLDTILPEPPLRSIFKNRPSSFTYGFKLKEEDINFVKSTIHLCYKEYIEKNIYWNLPICSSITSLFISLYRNYTEFFPITNTNPTVCTVFKVQKYIDEIYTSDILLKDLASYFHLDLYYLAHIFKDVTGYSIKQYIILKRISYAKNLLYYTNDCITKVATDCGFNNVNNFIRTFKKHEDISPLQFRKNLRL
jgi:AraC-like DNA-binding protein